MYRRIEIPVDRGNQIGNMVISLALPDVQLGFRLLEMWLAYYQVFIPYAPENVVRARRSEDMIS